MREGVSLAELCCGVLAVLGLQGSGCSCRPLAATNNHGEGTFGGGGGCTWLDDVLGLWLNCALGVLYVGCMGQVQANSNHGKHQ